MSRYSAALSVLVIGAVGALLILQRTWIQASVAEMGLGTTHVSFTGSSLVPVAATGAWIATACIPALLATKGSIRRVIGGLIVLAGALIIGGVIGFLLSDSTQRAAKGHAADAVVSMSTSLWWIALALAGALVIVAGLAVVKYADRWRELSAEQSAGAPRELSDWEALNAGLDPTAESSESGTDSVGNQP